MKLKIKNPDKLPLVKISELIATQGELKDLYKENYQKLKASFEKHGFIDPIAIYTDGKGQKHIIDGHQRKRIILKEYGDIEVPVRSIPAKDLSEAVEILLKITSQFGTITQEGLDWYISKYEIPEAEIYQAVSFDAIRLKIDGDNELPVEADVEFSKELREKHNYIVLVFEDEVDWLSAVDTLGLERGKSLNSKDNYQQVGIGRVINGVPIIKKLNEV